MSEWNKRKVSFKSFVNKEQKICKYTVKGYKYENSLFKKAIDLHINSIGYGFDLLYEGNKDTFYDAFIRLGIKILHNAESIRNLISLGLYGSASIIYRTLMFDTFMIWYLYFNPHFIREWVSEKFVTSKNRKWRDKFSEKTIIEDLKMKGKKYKLSFDYKTDFVFYSKVAHPTYFGIRFFQNLNGELAYLPEFNMEVGHLLFLKVLGLLPYPTQILLEKNKDTDCDHRLDMLRSDYNILMVTLNKLGEIAVKFHREHLRVRDSKDITET